MPRRVRGDARAALAAPRFFDDAAAFRDWLARHHASARELLVGLRKAHVRPRGLTYAEALDAALAFGWIDGVRRSMGETAFSIRFTPRRTGSIWSDVNVRRMQDLLAQGVVAPAGVAAFEAREASKTGIYAHERRNAVFAAHQEAELEANAEAAAFFRTLPPYYRMLMTHWVTSAKREATRVRRLRLLIETCARGERMDLLSPRREKSQRAPVSQGSRFPSGGKRR